MDKRTKRQKDKWTNGQKDKRTKGKEDKRTKGQKDKRKRGQKAKRAKGQNSSQKIFEGLCCILGTCTFLLFLLLDYYSTQDSLPIVLK